MKVTAVFFSALPGVIALQFQDKSGLPISPNKLSNLFDADNTSLVQRSSAILSASDTQGNDDYQNKLKARRLTVHHGEAKFVKDSKKKM
eukprot:gene88-118_t